MKRFITFLAILMAAMLSFAQIPQTMSYQAVVRDGDNALVVSKPVSIELSILRGSDEGDVVYAEKHDAATNANGLVSLELGNGEQISETAFSQIDWSAGPYFVKTVAEIDGKTVTGVTPLLAVPYAKYAEMAGNVPDMAEYAKKSDIPEGANLENYVKTEDLADYAKTADVESSLATLEGKIPAESDLTDYAKTSDVENALSNYVSTSDLNSALAEVEAKIPAEADLSDYAKKSDLDGFATTEKMNDTLNVYAKSTDVSGNYVTKEEFENYVLSGGQSDAVDLTVYAKSADVNAALAELEGKIPAEQDLSAYATTEKLNDTLSYYAKSSDVESTLSNYVSASELNTALDELESKIPAETNFSEYAKTADVESALAELENKIPAETNLTDYATIAKLEDTLAAYAKQTALDDYAKTSDVSATYVTKDEFETYVLSGGQTDAVDLSVYAKSSDVNAALEELEGKIPAAQDLSGFATTEKLNDTLSVYAKSETVPTKVSDLANDANYITLSDLPATDLTGYATSAEVESTLSNYVTSSDLNAALDELDAKIPAEQDLSGYATTAKLNDTLDAYVLKSQIGTTNLDGYYSKAEVDALLAEMNERFAALSDWVEASKNPKLSKPTLSKMVDTDVTLNAKITSAGFGDIIERGFVCSRTPNPTVTDNEQKYVSSGTSVDENYIGGFSYLASGYTYYIRAYATSSTGTGYSEPYILTTTLMAPVINSGGYRNVTAESFEMHSSVKFEAQITQWGFCYSSTSEYPTISGDKVTVDVAGTDFEATITGLVPGKTYYVRPFAVNSMGTTYGSTYFVTTLYLPATVENPTVSEIAVNSFVVTAVLTDDGGGVSSKGFCYSTSENPTVDGPKVSGTTGGGGNFYATVTGLSPNTTYYVRAFAKNSAGTVYSEQISVLTLALPTVANVTSSEVTGVSFKVSSEIIDKGSGEVTEKGFCYSTTENPTVEDNKQAVDGNDFETTIAELANGTTYYVRAYATNSAGTAYSEQVSVLTLAPAAVANVTGSDITGVSFKVSSSITANGGAEVTEKGFCYSITENPTVEDDKKAVDDDEFETTIDGLAGGTIYYVRAYAVNSVGIGYSEQFIVKTLPEGALNGRFSVSADKQIYFSQGNLQYQASTGTWRFAEDQYDMIGSDNSKISSYNSGWIDLFGWGTSGNNYKDPYMTSSTNSNYGNGANDIAGTKYDWGVFNRISNGGDQTRMWRTLTNSEWNYLINSRTNASSKYGVAIVNNVNGLVLLPDDWTLPADVTFTTGASGDYAQNTYSAEDWAKMETNGAVFLPAAGQRYEKTQLNNVGSDGYYWSSSAGDSDAYAKCLVFYSNSVFAASARYRYYGQSVRLVNDAN